MSCASTPCLPALVVRECLPAGFRSAGYFEEHRINRVTVYKLTAFYYLQFFLLATNSSSSLAATLFLSCIKTFSPSLSTHNSSTALSTIPPWLIPLLVPEISLSGKSSPNTSVFNQVCASHSHAISSLHQLLNIQGFLLLKHLKLSSFYQPHHLAS